MGWLVSRVVIHLLSLIFLKTVILSECLNHHHLDVVHLVAIGAEVSRDRLLCAFVSHVRAVAVHPFAERLLCLPHVLETTLLTADEVD